MQRVESPLNNIKIASPCSADWNTMFGSERKRFCGECKLNVYNLSAMSIEEAEELIFRAEGRLCVRYYRRADGTILTEDCPVGWARIKRRVSGAATAVAALIFAAMGGIFMTSALSKKSELGRMTPIPVTTPTPTHSPTPYPEPLMGAIAISSPTPTPTPMGEFIVGEIAAPTPKPSPVKPKKWRVVTLRPMESNEKAA